MSIVKYYHIGKVNLTNSFVYFIDVLAGSLFIGVIVFVFTQLWQVIYADKVVISGFTIAMMLWYFVMTESIVTADRHMVEEIGNEIRRGDVANYLNKPYSYLLYKYAMSIGYAAFKFGLTMIVGGVVVLAVIGGFDFNIWSLPFVAVAVFLAISLNFVIKAFLGVFAFWFEESHSLDFLYQKIVFVIGGMFLPLEIFPHWLASISGVLPFSYVAYHPARLFVMFDIGTFVKVVAVQLVWISIISALTFIVYKIGERRVSINGG